MYDLPEFDSLNAALRWANRHCPIVGTVVTVAYRERRSASLLGVLVRRPLKWLSEFSNAERKAAESLPPIPLTATSCFWLDVAATDQMLDRLTGQEAHP
jgi:hypothetical protein